MQFRALVFVGLLGALLGSARSFAQHSNDSRTNIQTVNTPRSFPKIQSAAQWESHAKEVREQILVSCGLWPMPQKTALNSRAFGKVNRDGYSVEKVYFQSYPGFYVAGNIYRPLGHGAGPFPAILNPHGHWDNGRMADAKEGSIAARCINFARQGMIAFSYDMVGYNDTFFSDHPLDPANKGAFYQRHRLFATNPTSMLWNISLMGLQTWNSIRALDFLESLPDVDKTRLACTGESGGGTQTYTLGAIDQRVSVQAPVVMVSHTMQGGCSCENVSGLRIRHSNVEIAAAAAPRPQIVVAATGDWTRDTMKMEGPAIEHIYRLMNATDRFHHVMFDFRHNYNQTSREAVYDFFGKWLKPASPASRETAYEKEPDSDLRVFPDDKLPPDAISEKELIGALVSASKEHLADVKPSDKNSLTRFKQLSLPAWKHTLQVEVPKQNLSAETVYLRTIDKYSVEKLVIGRRDQGDKLPAMYFSPEKTRKVTVVLTHPDGKDVFLSTNGAPVGLAKALLDKNVSVMLLDTFLTGELSNPEFANLRSQQVELFFTTYNKTDVQERVQDLVTAATYIESKKRHRVFVCGSGRAGLWALLAAPAVDGVIADCAKLNSESDTELLSLDLFAPGLRKLGGFESAAMLAAPNPLLLHNTGDKFSVSSVANLYGGIKSAKTFQARALPLDDQAIADWIDSLK